MNRIKPSDLVGPRAYFTDFDHRIVSRSSNLDLLRKKGERKLKVLLLLKGRIVCAASHLATRFAYDFFKDNSLLLTSEAVVPAFRADKTDLVELFARKRFPGRDDAIRFYKDYVQTTVAWELEDNSSWFRDRFLTDLEDDKSVLRRHLGEDNQILIKHLISEIKECDLLGRELIDREAKRLPQKHRRMLQNYRELLYHVSGAKVVNCESSLPQENYIDYDLADLSQKRARLTEDQILWKLFVEIVFDSLQRTMLPIELLDSLTFTDVMKVRQPILESNFQQKYDALIHSVVSSHNTELNIIFNIEELALIRAELANTFSEIIEKELPQFLKKKTWQQSTRLASVSSSVALNLLGAVPGLGLIASAAGVLKDSPALIFNIGQTYSSLRSLHDLDHYYKNKELLLQKEIDRCYISDKAPMLEMVNLLTGVIAQRITL